MIKDRCGSFLAAIILFLPVLMLGIPLSIAICLSGYSILAIIGLFMLLIIAIFYIETKWAIVLRNWAHS
jgi:hypothetical protein